MASSAFGPCERASHAPTPAIGTYFGDGARRTRRAARLRHPGCENCAPFAHRDRPRSQVEWRSNFCVLIGSCQRRSVVPAIGIVVVAMLASATLLGALALAIDCPIDDAFLALLDPRVLLNTPRFFSSSWQCTARLDPWVRS